LGAEARAGDRSGGGGGDGELAGGGRADGEGAAVGGGEGAVGEVECLGAARVDAQVGEGGDAGDSRDRGGALEGAGAGVDRRGDGGGVADGGIAERVAPVDGRPRVRRGACGSTGRAGRDHGLRG